MVSLSIIIVSYNTKDTSRQCLTHLKKNLDKYPLSYEVVVVDNASTDGSVRMLQEMAAEWKNLTTVFSKKNLGFGKGNNLGLTKASGSYILFLNSDAIVDKIDFNDLINLFEIDKSLGALTVKVVLSNGEIDPASHRGFPSLWRSFSYFLGFEKIFYGTPVLNRLFGGYHLSHLNLKEVHEIEVPTGAFFLTRKNIVDKIGGFDKDYFAYGEDIEMSWQIKKLGYRIIYYPLWQVLHLKSVSGLKKKDRSVRNKTSFYFYDSMKIFYRKHYAKKYPGFINQMVELAIDFKSRTNK
ncbi:glycosyltransferase family 2 protein [Patescibacteria group bacterium]|nr:glycosyltransferase family 2 protein [Patescibacteria group bacterium]